LNPSGATLNSESIQLTTWIALAVILSALFINQMFSGNSQVPVSD
jgi:hypothetical protein